ncbi:alpha/beta hydrolase [Chitinophaga lutea]|nr:alpha/beta hydrolase [Chitinophaga lutea]
MAAIILPACNKDDNNEGDGVTLIPNVAYGADARQQMDVYLPPGRTAQTPVVVFLHGGGFVAGDKADVHPHMQRFSGKGYAVVNVNYRLVDTTGLFQTPLVHKPSSIRITEQLHDVHTAIQAALAKTGEWNVSNTRWAIAGHSAGATLAMLYAYNGMNEGGLVKAAANWAGATDFSFQDESQFSQMDPRLVEVYYRAIGHEPKNANKLAYMAVSPYWIVASGGSIKPTLNVRPENNELFNMPDVSKILYEAFTNALNTKKIPNRHVEIAGADHGFSKPGNWEQVLNETDAFFRQYVP